MTKRKKMGELKYEMMMGSTRPMHFITMNQRRAVV